MFGNSEEKKQKELEKKQQELDKKMAEFNQKYGLTDLDEQDVKILEMIMMDLAGTGGFLGQLTSIGFKPAEMQTVNALWTLTRQNWLILRQLQKLNNKLDQRT